MQDEMLMSSMVALNRGKENGAVNGAGATRGKGKDGAEMVEAVEEGASSSSDGRPRVPKRFNDGRFHVRKKLGSGSYSDVYSAIDTSTGEEVAAKFEWKNAEKTGKVLAEAKLCKTFADRKNMVPFVRWFGSEGEFNIMVMDVLGKSLEDLLDECGGAFSLRTVLMLGQQMVSLLEHVHSRDILHRDIKPNNFLIGCGANQDRVYIVDFGLAKRYRCPDTGAHIPCNTKKGLTGTVRYTSLNVHRGLEPSRRDDLSAVGYVLMYFALGRLPWQGISAKSKKTKQRRIGRRKEKHTTAELCQGFPCELKYYLDYCEALDFDARPDYGYLNRLLQKALQLEMESAGVKTAVFDWLLPESERPQAANAKRKRVRSEAPPEVEPALADPIAQELADKDSPKRRKCEDENGAFHSKLDELNRMVLAGEPEPFDTESDMYETYDYETEEEYDYNEDEEEEEEERSDSDILDEEEND